MVADALTKNLPAPAFEQNRTVMLGEDEAPFTAMMCRPVSIAESQPALKVSFNRPRPRSQPARAGRACVLVVYFFSRQLGQL
jgi:hypothetical protein